MEYVDSPSYLQIVWAQIASVGWYIVGFIIIALYAVPYVQEKYKSWKFAKDQQNGVTHSKKTDELPQLSADVELARQKMQETYNRSSLLAQIKEEEEKEKKKQKILKLLESKDVGKRLGNATDSETPGTSAKSKSFKSGYSPLMGDNTRGYRPPKRSCCGKGGCG